MCKFFFLNFFFVLGIALQTICVCLFYLCFWDLFFFIEITAKEIGNSKSDNKELLVSDNDDTMIETEDNNNNDNNNKNNKNMDLFEPVTSHSTAFEKMLNMAAISSIIVGLLMLCLLMYQGYKICQRRHYQQIKDIKKTKINLRIDNLNNINNNQKYIQKQQKIPLHSGKFPLKYSEC